MRRAAPSLLASVHRASAPALLAAAQVRWCAASAKDGQGAKPEGATEDAKSKADEGKPGMVATEAEEENTGPTRNISVYSNTTKGVYIHFHNRMAAVYWFRTDFHYWLVGFIIAIVGSQLFVRYRVSKMSTVQQARLGENLLDQRTRDLLSDIETLREKDPLRLESEANQFHDLFWNLRAKKIAESRADARTMEINRGLMQGEARGTDMTEWLGAKKKDDSEREIARRTHDYIQGFHQHLKSKRLI